MRPFAAFRAGKVELIHLILLPALCVIAAVKDVRHVVRLSKQTDEHEEFSL